MPVSCRLVPKKLGNHCKNHWITTCNRKILTFNFRPIQLILNSLHFQIFIHFVSWMCYYFFYHFYWRIKAYIRFWSSFLESWQGQMVIILLLRNIVYKEKYIMNAADFLMAFEVTENWISNCFYSLKNLIKSKSIYSSSN